MSYNLNAAGFVRTRIMRIGVTKHPCLLAPPEKGFWFSIFRFCRTVAIGPSLPSLVNSLD